MRAVKPLILLEVTSSVTLLRRKSPTLPLSQLVGVVIETDKTSCTLTWKVTLAGFFAWTMADFGGKRKNRVPISTSTVAALAILLSIYLL